MSANPTTDKPDIPASAGLPARGGSGSGSGETPRSAQQLVDAAVSGEPLGPKDSDDLLAYYLSNNELPGDAEVVPLTVELGHGPKARKFACEIHSIQWSEWQDARARATDEKTDEFDAYISASWIVARALVTPKLGPTVIGLQKDSEHGGQENPPADAAELLRRMFSKQSGALLELSGKVLEISKLQSDNESVKEVEAGKA